MRPSTRKSLMYSFPLLIGALMAVGALTGCTEPERVGSTAPTVSYNVTGNSLTEANARAANYCNSYGAPPRLVSVQNSVATYSCSSSTAAVPPTYPAPTTTPAYPAGTSPIVR